MNLKEFITDTLSEIVEGVHVAANTPRYAGIIAPGTEAGEAIELSDVSFDVLVTTDEEGGGGLKVMGIFEAGGKMSSGNAHRVSFSVPVNLRANVNEGA
ncbi:hypothetical protein SLH49_08810 [Cognatiyoonia sp. IB215446]|uniref:hypothetical protein n=1 Tax=Cognatiyoonia sp. IB215446 TaxID=3097355 RepID=UPI002A16DF56|nr:hypothetical protein [Cognatiyoonia sp. IB215446]MDX8348085.1 hypothetical protein [Cognatiyoonia sp. IB215446]